MDEYLETLEIFYHQKMNYLTGKDKYIQCNTCKDNKKFIENEKELILSCSSKKNKCDPQIIIQLPK